MSEIAPASAATMQRALDLAARGLGYVEPNPMVGAVLTDASGVILAEGYHRRFGGPHAEVEALAAARERGVDPAGHTLYVTLEPCAHHGKTPPCADALIEARIGRCIVATEDPFPEVAGRGIERLRAAGIAVETGLLRDEAVRLNEAFFKRVGSGLPWIVAKWAQTLDGKIATSAGDSKWISSASSRRRVHELRARVDAIVVGVGTVLADDPSLTARDVEVRRLARRVVVDPRLRSPLTAKLLTGEGPPVTVAFDAGIAEHAAPHAGLETLRRRGIELLPLPARGGGRLELRPLFRHLAREHGAANVLVEGGSVLMGSLLEEDLLDQILAFVAPRLLGDATGLTPVSSLPRNLIAEAQALELRAVERIEDDVLLDYRVGRGGTPPPP